MRQRITVRLDFMMRQQAIEGGTLPKSTPPKRANKTSSEERIRASSREIEAENTHWCSVELQLLQKGSIGRIFFCAMKIA